MNIINFHCLCISLLVSTIESEEPHCSRFHYEEQTLSKMLRMEMNMEKMVEEFKDLKMKYDTKIAAITNQVIESEDLLDNTKRGNPHVSNYVRWGREDCPGNGTDMLYNGYMAGNYWNKHGGGSTSLCLPKTPTWAGHIDGVHSGAEIWGTEIEIDSTVSKKLFGTNVHDNDLSCALCTSVRGAMIMLPGHSKCLPGWTEEYHGYLAASYSGWKASSDFVCLDGQLTQGQDRGNNQHVIKVVEVGCGSLPCPPYVAGREMACVVCTK